MYNFTSCLFLIGWCTKTPAEAHVKQNLKMMYTWKIKLTLQKREHVDLIIYEQGVVKKICLAILFWNRLSHVKPTVVKVEIKLEKSLHVMHSQRSSSYLKQYYTNYKSRITTNITQKQVVCTRKTKI